MTDLPERARETLLEAMPKLPRADTEHARTVQREAVRLRTDEDLLALPGVGVATVEDLRAWAGPAVWFASPTPTNAPCGTCGEMLVLQHRDDPAHNNSPHAKHGSRQFRMRCMTCGEKG